MPRAKLRAWIIKELPSCAWLDFNNAEDQSLLVPTSPTLCLPLNRDILHPSPTQYCILVVAGGGSRYLRQQYRLRGSVLENDVWEAPAAPGANLGRDPSAVMGLRLRGTGSSNFLHVVSVASLQGPPPTLSRLGSVTNSMRHEWRCVTSKVSHRRLCLSQVPLLGKPATALINSFTGTLWKASTYMSCS